MCGVARRNDGGGSGVSRKLPDIFKYTSSAGCLSPCFHGCARLGKNRAIGLEREILCCGREVNKQIIEYKKFRKRKTAKHKNV